MRLSNLAFFLPNSLFTTYYFFLGPLLPWCNLLGADIYHLPSFTIHPYILEPARFLPYFLFPFQCLINHHFPKNRNGRRVSAQFLSTTLPTSLFLYYPHNSSVSGSCRILQVIDSLLPYNCSYFFVRTSLFFLPEDIQYSSFMLSIQYFMGLWSLSTKYPFHTFVLILKIVLLMPPPLSIPLTNS